MNLQVARQLADSDLAALKTLLEQLGTDVQVALDAVRRLAWGIYPSLLLERGLGEALAAAASEAGLAIRVEADALGRCSPEIEAAVYFCCVEVLRSAATIRLRRDRGTLGFDVVVRGAGLAPDLTAVRDRLGALGGRLTITSEPDRSTRISGTIPLDS